MQKAHHTQAESALEWLEARIDDTLMDAEVLRDMPIEDVLDELHARGIKERVMIDWVEKQVSRKGLLLICAHRLEAIAEWVKELLMKRRFYYVALATACIVLLVIKIVPLLLSSSTTDSQEHVASLVPEDQPVLSEVPVVADSFVDSNEGDVSTEVGDEPFDRPESQDTEHRVSPITQDEPLVAEAMPVDVVETPAITDVSAMDIPVMIPDMLKQTKIIEAAIPSKITAEPFALEAEMERGATLIFRILHRGDKNDKVGDISVKGAQGHVTDNRDGTITYKPPAEFTGEDFFICQIDEGNGIIMTWEITIIVRER